MIIDKPFLLSRSKLGSGGASASGSLMSPTKNKAGNTTQDPESRRNIQYRSLYKAKFAKDNIPIDPQAFYEDFGYLTHSRTGLFVKKLTDYQINIWNTVQQNRYTLVIKSQKVGVTTSSLLMDLQFALLPSDNPLSCRGKEILVIAQSLKTARDHLRTLRMMMLNSDKYHKYLITSHQQQRENLTEQSLLRDEKSKMSVLFINNPDDMFRPTRIIGLGATEGGVWSWKEVKFVHMSDIAATNLDYTGTLDAALTRLATTNGRMLIETPPRGPSGKIYDIYSKSLGIANDGTSPVNKEGQQQEEGVETESQFKIIKVHVNQAIKNGIITQEFVDSQRALLGPLFSQYYEAEFMAAGGNVFLLDQIERAESLGMAYHPDTPSEYAPKCLGIDPAFGSSKFAFVVTQLNNGKIEVIYAQEYEHADFEQMVKQTRDLYAKYQLTKILVDGSNPEFIRAIKGRIGESKDYHKQIAYYSKAKVDYKKAMTVVPINFNQEGVSLLTNAQYLMAKGLVAINRKFDNLLQQLRTAQEINGRLDKKGVGHTLDLVDAFNLNLANYKFEAKRPVG